MTIKRVTSFDNGTVVKEWIHNAKEVKQQGYMPSLKRIILPNESPLKAAGVDRFEVQTRKCGQKIVSAVSKNGERLATNWIGGGKPTVGNLKEFINALKKFALKIR